MTITDLAITPGGRVGDASPLGTKGPRRLDDYVRMVAHALMRKRGFTKSHAIATAKNALKKWARGGGKVRPQVRAGAAAHLAIQKLIDVGHSEDGAAFTVLDLAIAELEFREFVDFAAFAGLNEFEITLAIADAQNADIELAYADILADSADVELAATHPGPYRYRHGWIPVVPGANKRGVLTAPTFTPLRTGPAGYERRDFGGLLKRVRTALRERKERKVREAAVSEQRKRLARTQAIQAALLEDSRRFIEKTAAPGGPPQTGRRQLRRSLRKNKWGGGGLRDIGTVAHATFSEEQQAVVDLAIVEAAGRDIELAPHWRHGWIPLNAEALAIKHKLDGPSHHHRLKAAEQFFGKHSRAQGIAKVKAAGDEAKAASAAAGHAGDPAHAEAAKHAREVLAKVRKSEPKVTKDLVDTVGQFGGKMEALQAQPDVPGDFRFKSHDSLTRKIRDKAKEKGISHAEYASKVGDALRYTALFDNKTFVTRANKFLDAMRAKGYTINDHDIENSFARGQAYSGVNVNIKSPDGTTWELQLHTHESIKAKHLIHDDYEIWRSTHPSVTEAEKIAAYSRMVAVNRQLIRPSQFHKLGVQVHRPATHHHQEALIAAAQEELYRRGLYKRRRGRRALRTS